MSTLQEMIAKARELYRQREAAVKEADRWEAAGNYQTALMYREHAVRLNAEALAIVAQAQAINDELRRTAEQESENLAAKLAGATLSLALEGETPEA